MRSLFKIVKKHSTFYKLSSTYFLIFQLDCFNYNYYTFLIGSEMRAINTLSFSFLEHTLLLEFQTYILRIPNIYSQNPNSATSLPNTKFIFLKLIFIILCGPSLPMRPKASVLALISVMPKLISSVYQQLDCQMHTAEQLLTGQAA